MIKKALLTIVLTVAFGIPAFAQSISGLPIPEVDLPKTQIGVSDGTSMFPNGATQSWLVPVDQTWKTGVTLWGPLVLQTPTIDVAVGRERPFRVETSTAGYLREQSFRIFLLGDSNFTAIAWTFQNFGKGPRQTVVTFTIVSTADGGRELLVGEIEDGIVLVVDGKSFVEGERIPLTTNGSWIESPDIKLKSQSGRYGRFALELTGTYGARAQVALGMTVFAQ